MILAGNALVLHAGVRIHVAKSASLVSVTNYELAGTILRPADRSSLNEYPSEDRRKKKKRQCCECKNERERESAERNRRQRKEENAGGGGGHAFKS